MNLFNNITPMAFKDKDGNIHYHPPVVVWDSEKGLQSKRIVFCKDCKYWNKIDKAMYCTRHISIMHMDADDFCSKGEKKAGGIE